MEMARTHVLAALILSSAFAAEADVRRVFRAPRYERGMLNQKIVQPIDEAAWIWHADVRTDAAFLRFRSHASLPPLSIIPAFVRFLNQNPHLYP